MFSNFTWILHYSLISLSDFLKKGDEEVKRNSSGIAGLETLTSPGKVFEEDFKYKV